MKHIVLVGDSILDNAACVNGGRAVINQFASMLPQGWQASLLCGQETASGRYKPITEL
jgi:hypothetical protein